MKFIDRAFAATLAAFLLGSLAGALLVASSLPFRDFMAVLINTRALGPVRGASAFGEVAILLLVFVNNLVPVVLSFLYPLMIAKIRWEPAISDSTRNRLLGAFSLLTGALLGFFDLGATLILVLEIGGTVTVTRLLEASWVHAPLEFLFVLLCVAEPLRTLLRPTAPDGIIGSLRGDLKLLFICLIGLLASAAIEVLAGL
jgi:hypothetical protein